MNAFTSSGSPALKILFNTHIHPFIIHGAFVTTADHRRVHNNYKCLLRVFSFIVYRVKLLITFRARNHSIVKSHTTVKVNRNEAECVHTANGQTGAHVAPKFIFHFKICRKLIKAQHHISRCICLIQCVRLSRELEWGIRIETSQTEMFGWYFKVLFQFR